MMAVMNFGFESGDGDRGGEGGDRYTGDGGGGGGRVRR